MLGLSRELIVARSRSSEVLSNAWGASGAEQAATHLPSLNILHLAAGVFFPSSDSRDALCLCVNA